MEKIPHNITLDADGTAASHVSVCVKKGDTARTLVIHLVQRGRPYCIGEDCKAFFTARKPDGKVVYNDCSVDKCGIVYEFTEQTVSAAGLVECEIILRGPDGQQLTSASFFLIVEDTVYSTDNETESTDESTSLEKLIDELEKLRDEITAGSVMKVAIVTLYAANWELVEDGRYSQVLDIPAATANSMIEFKFSMEQLMILHDKDVAFNAENKDGVIVAYAMGTKPVNDYTVQATIQEVEFV